MSSCKFLRTRGSPDTEMSAVPFNGNLDGVLFAGKAEETAVGLPMGSRGALGLWGREGWPEVSLWGKQLQGQLQYPGRRRAQGSGDSRGAPQLCSVLTTLPPAAPAGGQVGWDRMGSLPRLLHTRETTASQFFFRELHF